MYMEILGALYEEPRGPSRLAQVCNINYARLASYLTPLEAKGFIRKETRQSQQILSLTELGHETYLDWKKLSERFQ